MRGQQAKACLLRNAPRMQGADEKHGADGSCQRAERVKLTLRHAAG